MSPWFVPSDFVPTAGCISRTNCSPDQYGFVPFVPGDSGRNIPDGPGTHNINLSLLKRWTAGERKFVQFRWETFNINEPSEFSAAQPVLQRDRRPLPGQRASQRTGRTEDHAVRVALRILSHDKKGWRGWQLPTARWIRLHRHRDFALSASLEGEGLRTISLP
jgi:hypothetical protein